MATKNPNATPNRLVIPSADFGGEFLSVFDPEGWNRIDVDMPLSLDAEGRPAEVIDAVTAICQVAGHLDRVAGRDACARLWPNKPYAAPLTPERWLQLLDQTIDDLSWARLRIAQEIEG